MGADNPRKSAAGKKHHNHVCFTAGCFAQEMKDSQFIPI
jgi:hypothetical protein